MPRFAANLAYLFTERPFIERFGAAAAAGFKAVELQFPYDHAPSAVKAELERHGLTMLGINTPPGTAGGEFGLAAVPGRERNSPRCSGRRSTTWWRSAAGRSMLAGTVPPEQRPAAQTVSSKNLTRAADAAAEKGITLLIEPINPRDRPDYFLTRAEHAADIIAKVERANVRIQFDFYHAQIVGGDSIRAVREASALVGHVQIAAVPSRHEPDEGEVNYPAIFAALDRLGYEGFVGGRVPAARAHRGGPRLGPALRRHSVGTA